MPVQINEVVIRAVVGPASKDKDGTSITPGCGGDGDNTDSSSSIGNGSAANDMAEQILELLRAKQER